MNKMIQDVPPEVVADLKRITAERDAFEMQAKTLARQIQFVRVAEAEERWRSANDAALLAANLDADNPSQGLQLLALRSPNMLRPTDAAHAEVADKRLQELERLFGPKSNSKLVNELALRDKPLYDRLREEAKERRLIG